MKKNIVIIILSVVILSLGSYLVYDKVLSDDNGSRENNLKCKEEEVLSAKDYDLAKAKELVDKYYINQLFSGISFDGYTEKVKFWLAYNSLTETQQTTVNCADLYEGKENVTKDPGGYIIGNAKTCDGDAKTITYDTMSSAYKYLFGSNVELKKEDISQFDYDAEKNIFILLGCRCGGANPNIYLYDVKTAKEIGDKIIIEVGYSILSAEFYNGDTQYRSDIDSSLVYTFDEVYQENFEKNYIKNYLDKMPTYKFDFIKDTDHYVLQDVVKILN